MTLAQNKEKIQGIATEQEIRKHSELGTQTKPLNLLKIGQHREFITLIEKWHQEQAMKKKIILFKVGGHRSRRDMIEKRIEPTIHERKEEGIHEPAPDHNRDMYEGIEEIEVMKHAIRRIARFEHMIKRLEKAHEEERAKKN